MTRRNDEERLRRIIREELDRHEQKRRRNSQPPARHPIIHIQTVTTPPAPPAPMNTVRMAEQVAAALAMRAR